MAIRAGCRVDSCAIFSCDWVSAVSAVEEQVCSEIKKRAEFGLKKYGVTVDRTDLN